MGVGTAGKSLSDYLAAYPGATITNAGLRVAAGCVGSGWSGFVGNFDALVIGVNSSNTIYDFEPDGVHITSPSTGDNHPGLPTFNGLSPAPFSTVAPGSVTISSLVSSDDPISSVAVTVNGQDVTPTFTGTLATDKTVTASVSQSLGAGTYTVIMTATDSNGDTFSSQWDFVVSSNQGDNEWFYADGTPKTRSDQRDHDIAGAGVPLASLWTVVGRPGSPRDSDPRQHGDQRGGRCPTG